MTNRSVTTGTARRPQARPTEILAAALELFAEKGFAATRMDDVAARAGLSKAGGYLYFKDKTALLKALVNELAGANVAVARGIVEAHRGPVSPLIATVLAFLGTQVRHTRFPELIKIVIGESRAHPEVGQLYLDTVINQGLPLFEGLIRRGIQSGEFRAVDPVLTARLMIGPMLLAIIWKTVFEPIGAEALDIEAYAAQHADIFLKGMKS